jgi:uncharacterized repeat protein (TIGR01451 family)
MKPKLLFYKKAGLNLLLLFLSLLSHAQTIGIPTVNASGGPITISFTVTNGTGNPNYFNDNTNYTVYLSDASGLNFQPIYTFQSGSFPASANLASANVSHVVPIPAGTAPGSGYKIAVGSTAPISIGAIADNGSAPFTLSCSFTLPVQLNGFIKCSSPAITYYVLTITNTGNLIDSYALTKVQSLYPLGSSFLSTTGAAISATPALNPGESYTFMMLFETPNGTPPDNWNTTIVTGTSSNCAMVQQTNISTYIYCGMNNSHLPDAPDMEIVKTASTASATVGDYIDYTITIKNTSTKNASNPVIKDFIPANAELISYNKAPGETRNVTFSYNAGNNTLSALVQSTMTIASIPLTINIRVRTNCQSVPYVTNSAEVYSVSGDHNPVNDVSSATTAVAYNVSSADVGTWTGNYNNDWFDCRNWSGGIVPNNNIDVVIPAATPNSEISSLSPVAPPDKTARAHHFQIESGATVSMVNEGIFHISGDWSSNGNFSAGNGNVTFMGAINGSYQNISDSTETTAFYNLTLNNANNGKGLSVPDRFGLFVHNLLDLSNGDIRLNGKSQLIQTKPGLNTNPTSGNGKVLIDQQGQTNIYSYNYWSSPVGSNNTYSISSVMKDGTDPLNPLNINWINGYNGCPTTPLSLATYWLFTFQNLTSSFANWTSVGPNGTLLAGQGYLMKGGGAAGMQQNYTFVGKPNNGQFTSNVTANYMNLSGNPYPSALDAHAFIDDNIQSTTGTLYFWEQFTTNSSHITANYEGGYATISKTGTTPPASPAGISSAGSSNRTPGRYIPVAQGFIVFGSSTGGTIKYTNAQRAFVRETDSGSNPMFRPGSSEVGTPGKKIRLRFSSENSGESRQVLLGFMDQAAADGFDKGYDAIEIDTQSNDIYFPLEGKRLVIQAKGFFNQDAIVPLGVKIATAGTVTFNLDGLENFDHSQAVFLHDITTDIFYELSAGPVNLVLQEGIYDNRFMLMFSNDASMMRSAKKQVAIIYGHGSLQVKADAGTIIEAVALFNAIGQKIADWKINEPKDYIALPVENLVPGAYITKVTCGGEIVSGTILIK